MPKSKTDPQGIFPVWAQDGEDTTSQFERYGSLPTATDMSARS